MATIKEVAELAEVSTATVSYVLNGTGKVAAETRRRVLEAVERLNYQPSHAARSLRGRSHTLGLVLPGAGRLADPALAELLAGLAEAAAEQGYHLLLTSALAVDEVELELQLVRSGRVDGLVLLDVHEDDERVAVLREQTVHYVCVGRPPASIASPAVVLAEQEAAMLAVQHLIGLGHQRIAMIQLPSELTASEPRYLGYRSALEQAGIEPDPMLVVEAGRSQEDGYQAMQELLTLPEPPSAVLACSDELAFGAIHLLHDEQLEVGRNVSLIGFDDVPLAAHTHPPLTTLRVPRRKLGLSAARILIDQIERRPNVPRQASFELQLIIRKSAGPPE